MCSYNWKNTISRAVHNKTLVNGSLFSVFSFFGQGISFVLLILLARFLAPDEYGQLSLFSTVVTAVGFLMAFSTRGYPAVTFFKKEKEEFKQDFTATIILGIISVGLLAMPLLFFGEWISEKLELTKELLWFTLLISFFHFIFLLQQGYLRVKERVISYGIYNCSLAVVNFLLTLFFVITFRQGWLGRVNAWLIGTICFGLLSFIFFIKNDLIRLKLKHETYRDALAWGLPMIPHAASGWIRQGIDRYIINFYHATYYVGVFSFAMNVANIIIMIGTAFNSTNSVSIYQILSDKNLSSSQKKRRLSQLTRFTFWIYVAATIAVVSIMIIITAFLLPKYISSIPLMCILAIAGFFRCIYFLYCNYLFYYNDTKNLMYITFGTSVIHLLLSLFLTRYSLYYTAIIYVFMMIIMTILIIIHARKLIGKELN